MQRTGHKSGFTIAELLIAVAIAGMLLAAVARQALTRITSQLRTAAAVDPSAPSSECSFITSTGDDITYRYDSSQGKLYLRTNSGGEEYVLCENVVAMNFSRTLTDDGLDCKSVQISLTVSGGNEQRTVSAAAAIRRNLN